MTTRLNCPRGVLAMTDRLTASELIKFVQLLERLNYESFWIPELFGREIMANAAHLLAHTERLVIATGIANVYVRDPHATAQARQTLAEFAQGRFILGLGVSNVGVNSARGHHWQAPAVKFNEYLDAMAAVEPTLPAHEQLGPMLLAAHGPALQRIAATRADGVMTYLMSSEHTKKSRARLGVDADLTVVLPVLVESDEATARDVCRRSLAYYTGLDYYQREWRTLGFSEDDFANDGSDRLHDHLVAWGTSESIEQRIAEHEAAGASRIVLLPLDTGFGEATDSATLNGLAPR